MSRFAFVKHFVRMSLPGSYTSIQPRQFSAIPGKKSPGNKITVNNVGIHYELIGLGKHPVLLLPGALGSTRTDFGPQLEQLNQDKLTLVAWDPPGYGYSRPPDRLFTPDLLHKDADIAAQLMNVLGYSQFSVLGWSDGGITALILASKHPSRMKKLVVWGANAYITEEDIKLYKAVRDVSSWSEKMRAPMLELYGEEYFRASWHSWVDTFIKIWEERGGNICKDSVNKITCPTLILHGEQDAMVPGEHPRFLNENIAGSVLHVMEKGKHNIHLRFAKEFNKMVQDFLLK